MCKTGAHSGRLPKREGTVGTVTDKEMARSITGNYLHYMHKYIQPYRSYSNIFK
jgi:hypothetical protein